MKKNKYKQPNILFIYLDDLGYGDPTCINAASKIPTPNIDRIAKEGIVFTDAHTPAAICGPSRYGVMTGRYPWRRGERGSGNGDKHQDLFMERDRLTMASLLKEAGYNTAQIGKWGIRHNYSEAVKPGCPFTEIDSYDFPNKRLLGSQLVGFNYSWCMTWLADCETKHQFENGLPVDPEWRTRVSDPYRWLPDSTDKAVEYIEVSTGKHENAIFNIDKEKPFFMYFDPPSPHEPIVPNKEFVGKSGAGLYGDFVMEIDHCIGQLLNALDACGLTENTIIIFSSDNGPEQICYERIRKYSHYSMGNWRGVKRDTWEGGHRLPLLVRWPSIVKPGRVVDNLVCLTDLLATTADIIEHPLPANAGEDSVSILPILKGDTISTSLRENVIHHTPQGSFAIRLGDWIYIDHPTGDCNKEPDWFRKERGVIPHDLSAELYNLKEDPSQRKNLYAEYPQRATKMKTMLKNIRRG
jgi:arylsulfatase A